MCIYIYTDYIHYLSLSDLFSMVFPFSHHASTRPQFEALGLFYGLLSRAFVSSVSGGRTSHSALRAGLLRGLMLLGRNHGELNPHKLGHKANLLCQLTMLLSPLTTGTVLLNWEAAENCKIWSDTQQLYPQLGNSSFCHNFASLFTHAVSPPRPWSVTDPLLSVFKGVSSMNSPTFYRQRPSIFNDLN